MMTSKLHRLALLATAVAFVVIVLGAYVRLSHAGLGCPDWPGCYGQLTWPDSAAEVRQANEAFPERPVEFEKAWKEMVHRYLAGVLVLLVVAINGLAWRPNNRSAGARGMAAVLLLLILFQAALGMWTVTLKLKPIIVMAHLLGGLATFSLLLWLAFRTRPLDAGPYTFVAADALAIKVREAGRVVNVHALIATGVNADGHREVLGLQVTTAEDGAGWLAFFRDLVARGLSGVALVTSDAHAGLVDAVAATLPGASWQRCRTHFALNLMGVTPKSAWPGVKTMLATTYDQPDATAVHAQFDGLLQRPLEPLALDRGAGQHQPRAPGLRFITGD